VDDKLELQKVLAQLLFLSPDDAAIDALNKIKEPTYEMGGVIFKNEDGQYTYSEPQSRESRDKFKATVAIPKGSTPAAIYHTHTGYGKDAEPAENFSPADVEVAKKMKMLSYIRAMESGNIKKYEPGKTHTQTVGMGIGSVKNSRGDLIYAKAEK
jgi:hypothetical protein